MIEKEIKIIDLKKGQCVRLLKGNYEDATIYEKNPFKQVELFIKFGFTNVHLIERIRMAREIANDRLIIQADGIPMSGGTDDFNTTLQAISIADIINKDLKLKDKKFKKLPILISGGTNSHTGDLARQCGVNFSGITIGTHARATVKNYLKDEIFDDESIALEAVKRASDLININLKGNQ